MAELARLQQRRDGRMLLNYTWPGNVRELRNVVERAVYRWEDHERPIDRIQFDPFESPWRPQPREPSATVEILPPAAAAPGMPPASAWDPESCADFRLAIAEYEKAILAAALEKCRWNQRAAAAALQPQLRPAPPRDEAPPAADLTFPGEGRGPAAPPGDWVRPRRDAELIDQGAPVRPSKPGQWRGGRDSAMQAALQGGFAMGSKFLFAAAALLVASPAVGAVTVIGNSSARLCYEAAESRSQSEPRTRCAPATRRCGTRR